MTILRDQRCKLQLSIFQSLDQEKSTQSFSCENGRIRSVEMVDLRPRIILLGASIVEKSFSTVYHGWGAGLADWYGRSADVINRGFSGYNSRFILQILPSIFPQPDTNAILTIICIGANDSSTSWQEVSLQEYQENLSKIIDYLQEKVNPTMKILLITPPIVDIILWPDRTIERTKSYAQAVLDLASTYRLSHLTSKKGQVIALSLWKNSDIRAEAIKRDRISPDLSQIEALELEDLYDGLHPGITGNQKILENLKILLTRNWPSLVPSEALEEFYDDVDGLPGHFPHFSDLVNKSNEDVKILLNDWRWD